MLMLQPSVSTKNVKFTVHCLAMRDVSHDINHILGEVALGVDVACFVINAKHKSDPQMRKKIEKMSKTHNVPYLWMDEAKPIQISEYADLVRTDAMKKADRMMNKNKDNKPGKLVEYSAHSVEEDREKAAKEALELQAKEEAAAAEAEEHQAEVLALFTEITR